MEELLDDVTSFVEENADPNTDHSDVINDLEDHVVEDDHYAEQGIFQSEIEDMPEELANEIKAIENDVTNVGYEPDLTIEDTEQGSSDDNFAMDPEAKVADFDQLDKVTEVRETTIPHDVEVTVTDALNVGLGATGDEPSVATESEEEFKEEENMEDLREDEILDETPVEETEVEETAVVEEPVAEEVVEEAPVEVEEDVVEDAEPVNVEDINTEEEQQLLDIDFVDDRRLTEEQLEDIEEGAKEQLNDPEAVEAPQTTIFDNVSEMTSVNTTAGTEPAEFVHAGEEVRPGLVSVNPEDDAPVSGEEVTATESFNPLDALRASIANARK